MSFPNNECGSCPGWLADIKREELIKNCCKNCDLFTKQKFVRHIPTQSCFPLEEDGKTIIISGFKITPKIDGKIFWEYVDKYMEKVITPTDPFHH